MKISERAESGVFRAKSIATQIFVLGISVLAEHLCGHSHFADLYSPGGYLYLQRQLQRAPAVQSQITIVDSSELPSPSDSPEAAEQFIAAVASVAGSKPRLIVLDIDLSQELGKKWLPQQVSAIKGLEVIARSEAPVVAGVSKGIGRLPDPLGGYGPNIRTGSVRALESLSQDGFIRHFPYSISADSETGESTPVVLAWEQAAIALNTFQPRDLMPPVLVVSEENERTGGRTGLINYAMVQSFERDAIPIETVGATSLKGRIAVIGDLEKPGLGDRSPIPGADTQAGVLTLASIFYSRLEQPLQFVPTAWETGFSALIGLLALGARLLATWVLCKLQRRDASTYKPTIKTEVGLSLLLIAALFAAFTYVLPSLFVFVPGFLASSTFALLEIPVSIFMHRDHND